MDRDLDWRKLDRHLAGESSADEAIEVERWIAGAPERAELVAALRNAEPQTAEGDVDASWRRLRSRMQELDTATAPLSDARRTRRVRTIGWRMPARLGRSAVLRAAAIVLLVVSAATWWVYRVEPRASAYAAAEIVTVPGERQTATLPDGSEVIVAPGSRVRYRRQGDDTNRVVELEGNAYFRVTADPERPFLVHGGGAETRVLGTEFDVRAFPEDDGVRVVVAEGTVSVRATGSQPDDAVLLELGDLGQVRADGRIDVSHAVDLDQHLAWTTGGLVFEDVSLGEALPALERRLGIDLRLADSALAARRLTIDLRSDSPDAVIEAISLVLDLSHEQAGDTVTLSPNR